VGIGGDNGHHRRDCSRQRQQLVDSTVTTKGNPMSKPRNGTAPPLSRTRPSAWPLTYRTLAAVLVGALLLVTYRLYWTRRASLAEAAALGVLGWFTFTNPGTRKPPLLRRAAALVGLANAPRTADPVRLISLTLLANMWLHDQLLLEALGRGLQDPWSSSCGWPMPPRTSSLAWPGQHWLRCGVPRRWRIRLE